MCLDTGIQTDIFTIQDQFCQTKRLEKDFQVQANLHPEDNSIAVQVGVQNDFCRVLQML